MLQERRVRFKRDGAGYAPGASSQFSSPNNVYTSWSGTHTSVTGSVSSVRFRQTDLEMVTPVQSVQSPGSVRRVFGQFSSVSSVSSYLSYHVIYHIPILIW